MSERDVMCPAETRGVIGGCRFCIYIPGGASDLCITKARQFKPEEVLKNEAAARARQIADTVKRMDAHGTGGRAGY